MPTSKQPKKPWPARGEWTVEKLIALRPDVHEAILHQIAADLYNSVQEFVDELNAGTDSVGPHPELNPEYLSAQEPMRQAQQ